MESNLHVYAQPFWHTNATIVGNTEAIKLLRQLCDMALESQTAGGEFMTSDGEGYHCRVICTDDSELWGKLQLPYIDEDARDRRENTINPNV